MKRLLAIVLLLASPALAEREVFAPTKLAPVATGANGKLIFAADTPFITGGNIYAANNLAVGTTGANSLLFATNTLERMRINSLGEVFVGNGETAPSPADANLRGTGGSGTDVPGGGFSIYGGRSTGASSGGIVRFFTSPAGVSGSSVNASVERMRILSDGDVYLGPGNFSATPPATVALRGTNGNGTDIAGSSVLIVGGRSTGSAAGGSVVFQTSPAGASGTGLNTNTERMRINSSGEVFVGNGETASSVANGNIRATGGSGTNINGADLILHGGRSTGSANGGNVRFFTSSAGSSGSSINASVERMRINSLGHLYLGNGETSATPASAEIRATNGSGTNIGGANLSIYPGISTGSGNGGIISFFTNAPGASGTSLNSSSERVRIKQGGQVRFVPLAADPTLNVEDGDVYYNSSTNKLRVRAAGSWVDLH